MEFDLDFSHHAYLFEGDVADIAARLKEWLGTQAIATRGNPDFFEIVADSLSIDDARGIAERQMRRTLSGGRQVFIIAAADITREAQNALLKVFEEPSEDTFFFVIVPHAGMLLPTLRSRFSFQSSDGGRRDTSRAEEFLAADAGKRLELIKPLIDEKDRSESAKFVEAIENVLYGRKAYAALRSLQHASQYLGDKGASHKLLLEYLCVIVPVM